MWYDEARDTDRLRATTAGIEGVGRAVAERTATIEAFLRAAQARTADSTGPGADDEVFAIGHLALKRAADHTPPFSPFRRRRWLESLLLLERAEEEIIGLLHLAALRQQYSLLHAQIRRWSERDDPRRQAFEDVVSGRTIYRDVTAERNVVIVAVQMARRTEDESLMVLSRTSTMLTTVATTLFLLAGLIAGMGAVWRELLPLCFETGIVSCPTGTRPHAADVVVIELVGVLGASITATASLRSLRETGEPVGLALRLYALKLPTGAIAAVCGILLLQGRFLPGFGALRSTPEIIGWALVFGAAQQLLTRPLDRSFATRFQSPPAYKGVDAGMGQDAVTALSDELSVSVSRSLRDNLRESLVGPALAAFDGSVSVQVSRDGWDESVGDSRTLRYEVRVTISAEPPQQPSALPLSIPGVNGIPVFRVVPESDYAQFQPAQRELTMSAQTPEIATFTVEVENRAIDERAWISIYQNTHLVQVCQLKFGATTP